MRPTTDSAARRSGTSAPALSAGCRADSGPLDRRAALRPGCGDAPGAALALGHAPDPAPAIVQRAEARLVWDRHADRPAPGSRLLPPDARLAGRGDPLARRPHRSLNPEIQGSHSLTDS